MSFDFTDILNLLDGEDFEERPVSIEEFVTSEDYSNLPPLSEHQYTLIRASSQIYKLSTLVNLYGEEEAEKRWKETMNEIIFQLGKGTLVKESWVYSRDFGYKQVADLLDTYEWQAESVDGTRTATEFFSKGYEDVYKVRTRKGYESTVAAEHRLHAWNKSRHGMTHTMKRPSTLMSLSELNVGDVLAIKRGWTEPKPEVQYSCTPDEARVIGYMIGDGTWMRYVNDRPGRNACFTNSTESVQNDFTEVLGGLGATFTEYQSGMGCWAVRVNGASKWMQSHGLIHAYNEKKPWNHEWMRMSDVCLGQLLNGIWATDGWAHIQRRANGQTSTTTAVELNSESLARGIHAALLRLGVVSKFKHHRKATGTHSDTYRVEITSLPAILRFLEVSGNIVGKEAVCEEIKQIAFEMGKVADAAGIFGDTIESIEYVGHEEIFTCTVDDSETYLADCLLHGNSGKGYTSSIAVAYVVYLLLCLKDPARYYGKPPGDHIAILNIAINAAQAQNVFFKYFKQRILSNPWFVGKYTEKTGEFQFDKNVFVYSGHSEREAWEGYNVIFVILDEISGFALESTSGNEQAKTASAVYKMYKQSVTSRFAEFGKIVLLSFPRFKNDFIQQRYNDVIAEKETIIRKHTFKVNPDLPDGYEGNEFDIEWEEDHILSYRIPKVFALKRPTWEINPLVKLDDLMAAFYDDPIDTLSRFACMPPDAIDAFFKDRQKIEDAFSSLNGNELDGAFRDDFVPDPEKRYFVHVDLARVHDHAAVAMAHVEGWEQRNIGGKLTEPAPVIKVDAIRYWTPSKTKNVDFTEIREYILSLKRRGFDIKLTTFDRWESADTMQYLNERGMKAERLSVAKKHYEDFAMVVAEGRLVGPKVELLIDELLQLRIMKNDRVDHPRKGSKDLADAVCGAIYNAIAHTPKESSQIIEIKTLQSVRREIRRNEIAEGRYEEPSGKGDGGLRPPKREMPKELEEYFARLTTI